MNIYKANDIGALLESNPYAGRGIVIGKSANGRNAVCAYFIMGRSENSRNRIFTLEGQALKTAPFDPSKVKDPSLIIYNAVRRFDNKLIITNGDQTDTIYEYLAKGKGFKEALETREFEPDAPNFTPRISGMLTFDNNDFTYEISILKSIDQTGSGCCRCNFSYPSKNGLGHFIHTYNCDGDPLPSFTGEPKRVEIPDDIDLFASRIWGSLDSDNKISLFVLFVSLEDGREEKRLINKNEVL